MIEGSVRCACPDNPVIAGAEVVLWKLPRDGERVREVRTDARGYFRIGGVAAGTYLLDIAADDHSRREVQVTVSQGASSRSIDALLEPTPPGPTPIKPDALVRSAELATYPADARRSGVEGVVRLRLSTDSNGEVGDIDVDATMPELRRAALANVRTWDVFMIAPVLTITYTYRLLPGDCTADQQPRITMRFPHVVEVTARRTIPCGG
jgi:TonB family protein